MAKIQRALLSVTDKSGIVEFARALAQGGVELISTGGTAKALREAGVAVKDISELTGFPEMLDGRVKTLHPKVHGGILHMRGNPEHVAAVREHGIQPIDMVVVNLYAFEKTAAKPGVRFDEVIENIDIGGPSMVRSAAKNFRRCGDRDLAGRLPGDSGGDARPMAERFRWLRTGGWRRRHLPPRRPTMRRLRRHWSECRAPAADGGFDAGKLAAGEGFPQTLRLSFEKAFDLRYGENPHQKAALYSDGSGKGVANGKQLQGKELSLQQHS